MKKRIGKMAVLGREEKPWWLGKKKKVSSRGPKTGKEGGNPRAEVGWEGGEGAYPKILEKNKGLVPQVGDGIGQIATVMGDRRT